MARKKHPRGLVTLFFVGTSERFGYYLMLGIFMLYMTKTTGLGMDKVPASDIYGTFIALVYLTPFFGGLLADRILGYRVSILLGGFLMGCGYIGMALPHSWTVFWTSLLLISVGNGFFKPCISVMLGRLYETEEYRDMKDTGYNIFYMGINLGAFLSNFVAAYLRIKYNWGYAFAAAGVGMFLSILLFLYGNFAIPEIRRADRLKKPQKGEQSLAAVVFYMFLPAAIAGAIGYFVPPLLFGHSLLGTAANDAFFALLAPVCLFYFFIWYKATKKERDPIAALLVIFTVVIVFWALLHQNGAAIVYWAEEYTDRTMDPITKATVGAISTEKVSTMPREREIKKDRVGAEIKALYADNYDTVYKERFVKIMEKIAKNKEAKRKKENQKEVAAQEPVKEKDKKEKIIGPAEYYDNMLKSEWPKGNFLSYSKEELAKDPLLGRPSDLTYPEWMAIPLEEKVLIAGRPGDIKDEIWLDFSPEERKEFGELELWPAELQASINPFFVLVMTPFVVGFFGLLRKHHREPSTPAKIGIGLLLAGISVWVMVAAVLVAHGEKSSVAWLIGFYGVITVGELCLSPMGLSLVSKLSPPRIVGVMMGGWFLSSAFGNKMSGVLSGLWDFFDSKAVFFMVNSLMMLLAAAAVFFLLPWLRRVCQEHMDVVKQEEAKQADSEKA